MIERAFQRDFEVNGPSILRVLRTTLAGWKRYQDHPNQRIRRRFAAEVENMVSAFSAVAGAATRYYRGNPAQYARMTALLREMKREFGLKSRVFALGRFAGLGSSGTFVASYLG
jgi:ABC-type taurine transport system substrate-binding protein